MRSGKLIDISKSSLVSLKAELAKKQEEARQIKESGTFVKLPPRPKPLTKVNAGVNERNRKDLELTSEEVDLLKKSREVLEIKASLYDKLQNGSLVSEDGKERFLVDFGRKSPQPSASDREPKKNVDLKKFDDELEKISEPVPDDDVPDTTNYNDGEWVEYTDCLGRTRRCHKTDWDLMKDKDKNLAKTLHKERAANIISNPNLTEEDLAEKEMLSHDMHLELLRRKWEDKERELMDKDNVHYEDVLFDEARSHGVGYWRFSTDPEKREKEQEMLRKVRAETEQRQKEAKALRDRREQQRQARLIAARQRQRARLGLPPIEIVEDTAPKEESQPDPKEEEEKEVSENLEVKLQKAAHVRPWDVGKDGLKNPLLTQEEWNEKKRAERPKEFAPVYSEDTHKPKRKKFDLRPPTPQPEEEEEEENPFQSRTKNFLKKRKEREEVQKRKGAEIPPPMDFDYHTPNADRIKSKSSFVDHRQTAEAIDAGLRLLREQFEKDQNAVPKGEL